jgi:hypothetical protein
MKKSNFTEEQVAYALRLAESGTPVAFLACSGFFEPIIPGGWLGWGWGDVAA